MDTLEKKFDKPVNPVVDAVETHPIGTGVGAVAGAVAAGAAAGSVAGPVGTAVGAVAGAVAGALVGNVAAEKIDHSAHDVYWRDNFYKRPYVESGSHFDDYGPAYRLGLDTVRRHEGKTFDEAESEVSKEWHGARDTSKLEWDKAKHAVRDAWNWVKTDIDHD